MPRAHGVASQALEQTENRQEKAKIMTQPSHRLALQHWQDFAVPYLCFPPSSLRLGTGDWPCDTKECLNPVCWRPHTVFNGSKHQTERGRQRVRGAGKLAVSWYKSHC